MEDEIKLRITYSSDTGVGDTSIDLTRTYFPVGELVIVAPYDDTDISDTSKYRLCWKFAINPVYFDTFVTDTNTVDTMAHYDTVSGNRRHAEVFVYVDAHSGNVYSFNANVESWTGHLHPTCYDGDRDFDLHYNGFG